MELMHTYNLEMSSYTQFRPAYINDSNLSIIEMEIALPTFYRYLYNTVGQDCHWIDRVEWSDEQVYRHFARTSVSIWVAYYKGVPAGYFELERQAKEPGIEIDHFGLFPSFRGCGLGKHLLSFCVEQAWKEQPCRVWLFTRSLDGTYALPNYLKRGFQIYRQEVVPVPKEPAFAEAA